jgi:hypothetical protein
MNVEVKDSPSFYRELKGETPKGEPLHLFLFIGEIIGDPVPSSEIKEIRAFTKEDIQKNRSHMTPMTLQHILPAIEKLW